MLGGAFSFVTPLLVVVLLINDCPLMVPTTSNGVVELKRANAKWLMRTRKRTEVDS